MDPRHTADLLTALMTRAITPGAAALYTELERRAGGGPVSMHNDELAAALGVSARSIRRQKLQLAAAGLIVNEYKGGPTPSTITLLAKDGAP